MTNVIYTVNGAGVTMWDGYCADMAKELVKRFPTWYWQPVGNWDTRPVPMKPGVLQGVDEHIRLLQEVHPVGKWVAAYYSEGAIIGSNVLDKLRDPRNPVAHRLNDCLGVVAYGNPRREKDHTFPGGIKTSGFGVVEPNLKDTPVWFYDFANGDEVPGSGGEDLYCTASDANPLTLKYIRGIWRIVYDGNPTQFAVTVAKTLFSVRRWPAAVMAISKAAKFFASGTHPHISYHESYPLQGDARDSWRIGLDYLAGLMMNNP